jgi:hypothetical protein
MPLMPGDVKVTNITNIAKIGKDGQPARFKNVQFTVRESTVDAIEVPLELFTADYVRQAVATRAAEIVAILEM